MTTEIESLFYTANTTCRAHFLCWIGPFSKTQDFFRITRISRINHCVWRHLLISPSCRIATKYRLNQFSERDKLSNGGETRQIARLCQSSTDASPDALHRSSQPCSQPKSAPRRPGHSDNQSARTRNSRAISHRTNSSRIFSWDNDTRSRC